MRSFVRIAGINSGASGAVLEEVGYGSLGKKGNILGLGLVAETTENGTLLNQSDGINVIHIYIIWTCLTVCDRENTYRIWTVPK